MIGINPFWLSVFGGPLTAQAIPAAASLVDVFQDSPGVAQADTTAPYIFNANFQAGKHIIFASQVQSTSRTGAITVNGVAATPLAEDNNGANFANGVYEIDIPVGGTFEVVANRGAVGRDYTVAIVRVTNAVVAGSGVAFPSTSGELMLYVSTTFNQAAFAPPELTTLSSIDVRSSEVFTIGTATALLTGTPPSGTRHMFAILATA